MNPPDSRWSRLVAAARQARDERDTAAPYGFATRVVARAFAAGGLSAEALAKSEQPFSVLLARFSWRALGIAALLAVLAVAANYSAFSSVVNANDDDSASRELTNEVLELSS